MTLLDRGQNRPSIYNQKIKFDLGITNLVIEWRRFFSKKYLKEDFISGISVASVQLPLALAIALASGIEPARGLITAIIGSLVCSLFSGTQLLVSGPAIAMAVLIADVVQDFGLLDLLIVGFLCGIFQVLTGVFRLSRFVRFVPLPVLSGFIAGIGAIIVIGQLPSALGLPPPSQVHNVSVIHHVWDYLHEMDLSSFSLASIAVVISFALPRFFPKLPTSLIAIALPSVLVALLGIHVQSIGMIPSSFPSFEVPSWSRGHIGRILWTAFIVFALASMETLLASSAIARLAKNKRYDPDQELIGQGLGNMASSLFGGIPITAVYERSARNVYSGGKTRRSVFFSGILLILILFLFSSYLSQIPKAALTGVILSIALRMLHPREFIQIWKASGFEALIYLVTFCVTLFTDLILGVQAGVIAALLISAIRIRRTGTNIYNVNRDGPLIIELDGDLNFLSLSKLEAIRKKFDSAHSAQGIVFDLTDVSSLDISSGRLLFDLFEQIDKKKIPFAVRGISENLQHFLEKVEKNHKWSKHFVLNEADMGAVFGNRQPFPGLDKLVYGVEKFRREARSSYASIFRRLETTQNPHTLFITCSDSRINPNLITSTGPGELFILRNVGNLVPPFGNDSSPAEGAAIEYAVAVLGVKEIVVCGHSECGAIKYMLNNQLLTPELKARTPSLSQWMTYMSPLKAKLPKKATTRHAVEMNAILQIKNLKTYPEVKEKVAAGSLRIHVWYYDIGKADLEEWDQENKIFIQIGDTKKSLDRRIAAGVQVQVPME